MKRVFLGASALLLAIAGIVATKATVRVSPYYYLKGSVFVTVPLNTTCSEALNIQCYYTPAGSAVSYPIYAAKTTTRPLKKAQ